MFLRKKSSLLIYLMIISFSLIISSCASVINGNLAPIAIDSYPNNAIIKVNGQIAGITPTTIMLKRGEIYTIEIQKEGYKIYKVITTKPTSDMIWGNIFFGGLYGLFLDYSNGNAYNIEPKEINAKLEKEIGLLPIITNSKNINNTSFAFQIENNQFLNINK